MRNIDCKTVFCTFRNPQRFLKNAKIKAVRMTEIITSTKNQFVKKARSLSQKKFRKESGLFLVEGANIIKDMPSFVEVEYVLATPQRQGEVERAFGKESDGKSCDALDFTRAQAYYVSEEVMAYVADTVSPYGICAVCKMPSLDFQMPTGNALLLDGVSDPGNLGTILRTAAACNFCDVYLLDTADVFSPKVVRATLGGLFRVRLHEIDEAQALALLQNTNSAVLDMGGENILENKPVSPTLLVAGNEAHGVREVLKRAAKNTYSLPMKNEIESLNVAVATAVSMYQTL